MNFGQVELRNRHVSHRKYGSGKKNVIQLENTKTIDVFMSVEDNSSEEEEENNIFIDSYKSKLECYQNCGLSSEEIERMLNEVDHDFVDRRNNYDTSTEYREDDVESGRDITINTKFGETEADFYPPLFHQKMASVL